VTERHVSALELDALALASLAPDHAAGVRAHLARCPRCREDERAAAELRAEFVARVLPRGLRPDRLPGSAAGRWWLATALALAAAAIAIAVWPRSADPVRSDRAGDLAIKGEASWQVFASRGGRVFAVHDGIELAPGDQIRFAVTPGAARYLLVASVDGLGTPTIYYPYDGARSAEITGPIAGERVELPGSIMLDAAPGPERIYALLSATPLSAEEVREQLRRVGLGGAAAIRSARRLAVPAPVQASLVFEKAVP